MNHALFIGLAYSISALILLWTALAPLVRQKRLHRSMQREPLSIKAHDPNP